jgi:hypothetical protein
MMRKRSPSRHCAKSRPAPKARQKCIQIFSAALCRRRAKIGPLRDQCRSFPPAARLFWPFALFLPFHGEERRRHQIELDEGRISIGQQIVSLLSVRHIWITATSAVIHEVPIRRSDFGMACWVANVKAIVTSVFSLRRPPAAEP